MSNLFLFKSTHRKSSFPVRSLSGLCCIYIFIFISFTLVSCVSRHLKPGPHFYTPVPWEGSAVVLTKYGAVRGYPDAENTFVWKGIPYAAPPVRTLRWKAPREHWPWEGVLDARSFGNQATQFIPALGIQAGNEDCLFLNVWRPQTGEQKLPVYVWIHGGANTIGSAHYIPDYYGHATAGKAQVVFVSINYRLGIFGWFYYPSIHSRESPEDASGNYGTLDILFALQWIKENISAFGGDPGNVTVAGESAGAMNILSLLTSPLARGLFHKAVIESGITGMTGADEARLYSRQFLAKLLVFAGKAKTKETALKLTDTMSTAEVSTFLYSRSQTQLMHALSGGALGMADVPAIITDGYVLPKIGYAAFASGSYPVKVPVLIGSNKDEAKLFLSYDTSLNWKSTLYAALAKYRSLRWKAAGVDAVAYALSLHKDQPPVYAYRFDWGAVNEEGISPFPGDWGTKLGAFHSLEIPFFLGTDTIFGVYRTLDLFTKENVTARKKLSAAIMQYLAAFAYSGNPNMVPEVLPTWEFWNPDTGLIKSLVFDTKEDNLHLSYLEGMLTREAIDAEMYRELKEPLLSEVLKRLDVRPAWAIPN